MKPITFTDDNFDAEVIKSDLPVVIDFWAAWCGPCRMLTPVLERVSDDLEDKVSFYHLDVDESPDASSKFGIRGV
ncbi:MAG: thiol reductase thioredoxin, partial [Melioribacteraceae bacterium]|nr:thiol reductase thioredoxin [Melioribacteraceae bacterium]